MTISLVVFVVLVFVELELLDPLAVLDPFVPLVPFDVFVVFRVLFEVVLLEELLDSFELELEAPDEEDELDPPEELPDEQLDKHLIMSLFFMVISAGSNIFKYPPYGMGLVMTRSNW